MTLQLILHLFRDSPGTILAHRSVPLLCLAMTVVMAATGTPSFSQSVTYLHDDHRPVTSRPVARSVTSSPPQFVAPGRIIRSGQFGDSSPGDRSTVRWGRPNQAPTVTSRPERIGRGDPSRASKPTTTAAAVAATRLASTNPFLTRPNDSPTGPLNRRQPTVEPVSRYSSTMIESARQSANELRRIAQTKSPVAAEIADQNAEFAEQWVDLAGTYAALSVRVDDANAKLLATRRDFDDVNAKLTQYGLTPTIGMLLRHKQEQLNAWQVHDSQTVVVSQELGRSRQQQLELELVRFDGSDPEGQAAEILADAGQDSMDIQYSYLRSQVESLLHHRHQWLGFLQQGFQDYQEKLGEFDSTTTMSAKLIEDYRKLIDRHITWIRSGDPLSVGDARKLRGGLAALFNARRSGDFGPTLERKFKSNSIGSIGLFTWIVLLSLVRWRAKSWLIGIGSGKRMREAPPDTRRLTAGVLTTLVALVLPCMLYLVARWLGTGVVSESTLNAASGFYAASMVALMVEVPRQLLRNNGYIDKHVDVDLPGRQAATRYLVLLGIVLVVAAYAITLMSLIDHGMWRGSVARLGFMATMLVVAWTAHKSLRPTGGLVEPLIARFGGGVIYRIRLVIYLAGLGFPLGMLILSALGYGFTANELIKRAIITLVCGLIAWTLWAGVKTLAARAWQMLAGANPPPRQFDEYGEIETRRESAAQVTGKLGEHFLELKHHLAFLCQCGLVLGAIVGFGWLWIDIFPNVRMGNPVVWTVQETVTQSSIDAAGQAVTSSVAETTPITMLHLVLAAATLFVAFQLAKLLPALWDALVLQRVSFDEGMEHFSLVLGRCLLFGVGCLVACRLVGLRWHTIEWLAVGLAIGMGFGLQDMVRNLFGGLIVLFEKPARLGDQITVGKVTGRVAMQKFRTTVLSDDDGREVIIPNKKFVSEDVVNWMGAGRLSVIPLEVAVTRDERPADICRTLQELVIEQQHVLLTPAPQATLVCVGKSSQRIEVRAWIEERQDASRFRDSLLKVVTKFLRDKDLLAATQPPQPAVGDSSDSDYRYGGQRSRKRSA